jgi:hypothetical protein
MKAEAMVEAIAKWSLSGWLEAILHQLQRLAR